MPDAELTFSQNIEYLEDEWNEQIIAKFLERVDKILQAIKENPYIYPLENPLRNIHKCVVNKHIIKYYRITNNTSIDILLFWNTAQNPEKLRL